MLSDKDLLAMYKNAKTPTEQMLAKKELIQRGFKFAEDHNYWYIFWTACCVVFISIVIFTYFIDIKNKIIPTIDVKPLVADNSNNDNDNNNLKSQIEELKLQNEELNKKITKLNNRLFGFAVTSQENWGRIKKNNKDMITLDKNWLPDRQLEFMQNASTINGKIDEMRSEGNVKLE